jgi:hypothetical protein
MRKQMKKPKSYRSQDGCHNCEYKNHIGIASEVYPVCTAYQNDFWTEPYGICERWELYIYKPKIKE